MNIYFKIAINEYYYIKRNKYIIKKNGIEIPLQIDVKPVSVIKETPCNLCLSSKP